MPNLRHPEKYHKGDNPSPPRPDWLRVRVKAKASQAFETTKTIVKTDRLTTVCEEAACPNLHECWAKNHATFMLMGEICTRACSFCYVATGLPQTLDPFEPLKIAKAVAALALTHVVITSVNRDDLVDGGAEHFAQTIRAIRRLTMPPTIEILTPDFKNKPNAKKIIAAAGPEVFNHNLETVPRLYRSIRPGARYDVSLALLADLKNLNPTIFTKTGLMLGLGETRQEILQVMDDARLAKVDFLTLGQYLQPTKKHAAVAYYWSPKEFQELKQIAYQKGFLMVASSPLTRSSYHAGEDFAELQKQRQQQLANVKT